MGLIWGIQFIHGPNMAYNFKGHKGAWKAFGQKNDNFHSVPSIMNQLALETTNTEIIQNSPKLTHTNKSKFKV